MKSNTLHRFASVLGIVLFGLALWVLHDQMQQHKFSDVMDAFRGIPMRRVWLAVFFTVIGFACLTGYDYLAIHYINRRIHYSKIALAAVIGYAFSNSIGHSFLTGGTVRYRLYTGWGLSVSEIAKVVVFAHVTFYLGTLLLIGIGCIFEPQPIMAEVPLSRMVIQPIGALMVAFPITYLLWSLRKPGPVRIRSWELPVPSFGLSFLQIMVATLDLALAGAVLYVLLPPIPGWTFLGFMSIFMLAQVMAVATQVPGGIGVFEAIMLRVLSEEPPASVLGALLAYRIIYYLMPLALSAAALGLYELRAARRKQS